MAMSRKDLVIIADAIKYSCPNNVDDIKLQMENIIGKACSQCVQNFSWSKWSEHINDNKTE